MFPMFAVTAMFSAFRNRCEGKPKESGGIAGASIAGPKSTGGLL
jgi:hypothetical protein